MIDPAKGYDPDDQFHYSRRLVAELLPMALAGPEPPARGLTDTPGGVGDPAEGGNMLAMLLDVRWALDHLESGEKRAVYQRVLTGGDVPDYILDEMVEWLGGPRASRP